MTLIHQASTHCYIQPCADCHSATQVLVLKQEISHLREIVQRMRQDRPLSLPQSPEPQPPVNALSTTDAVPPNLAQQQSQAVVSPSTPSHSPWVSTSANSVNSNNTSIIANDGRGLSNFNGSHALFFEAEGEDDQFEGGFQGALDPLLLQAANVMTNPMFGMDGQGTSVPPTPTIPAPRLLQAVALQHVGPQV